MVSRGVIEMNDKECCDPQSPLAKCLNCDKIIHTCERTTAVNNDYRCPLHKEGFEDSDGNWFCCGECYDKYLMENNNER